MAKVKILPHSEYITVIDSRKFDIQPQVDPETGQPACFEAVVVNNDPTLVVIPCFFSEAECDHLIDMVEGCWMPSRVGFGGSRKDLVVASGVAQNVFGSKVTNNKTPADVLESCWMGIRLRLIEMVNKCWAPPEAGASEDKLDPKKRSDIQNSVSSMRTSWSCSLRYAQTDVVERLEHRVASIADLPHGVKQLERFFMVRYAPGEAFSEHHDGKFRPKTVFVYLNDLPEDSENGDTFFPVLGYSFKPRKGTAVMWTNVAPDGSEADSRMVHAGRAPTKGVKYGVNCFTNDALKREFMPMPSSKHTWESAAAQRISDLLDASVPPNIEVSGVLIPMKFEIVKDPQLDAIPSLLSSREVEEFSQLARTDVIRSQPSRCFERGTHIICHIEFGANSTIAKLEGNMCNIAGEPLENLAKLRIVRPALQEGLCNRGCGKHSLYVCLGKGEEEVLFPHLGIRLILRAGDALSITNVNFDTNIAREDMRGRRVHRSVGGEPPLGIDAHFHDNPLRLQQKKRKFVSDADAALICTS